MRSWRAIAARIVTAVLALAWAAPSAAASSALERAVKATYLYKLAPFVTWPASVAAPGAPLNICVQGTDPFGALLDRAVAGQAVAGRPVTVRRVPRLDAASGCAVAYVAGSPAQSRAQALAAVEHAPVLTVTDEGRGAERGIVNLVLDGGRVRFSIDAGRAAAAGLDISSKLLALAVVVRR
jgi:hypothetical protein